MSVYNREEPDFFDLAIESNLVKQSLLPDEFVLVCDGELTDGLEAVIDKYTRLFPDKFKVYRKENGGLGRALNFGLSLCSHPLVARSDSDDLCVENRFEKQIAYMDEHPDVNIISSYIEEFDTDWTQPIRRKPVPLTHEEIKEMARTRNPMNHMAIVFRKDDILRIGSYHHIPCVEDYELWVRALVAGLRFGNIGEYLIHARVGHGMLVRRGNREYIKSWHTLSRYMMKNGMIGICSYLRNMTLIIGFVYTPPAVKDFIYKKILRR